MASNKERNGFDGEGKEAAEPKIPVFTVIKNGAILKNIFIVNNKFSTPNPNSPFSSSPSGTPNQEDVEILIVGRHPDCNIMLTHPSISRFHLHIISNPLSQSLFVVDVSSIHGTWVCDKRIEPWVRVEMKEGDTLRVGGSSRVYRLQWIPLRSAYHFENPPQVLASDVPMAEEEKDQEGEVEEEEEDNAVPEEENSIADEVSESEYCLGGESQEIQSLGSIAEEIKSFFLDENSRSVCGFNLEDSEVAGDENDIEVCKDEICLQIQNKPVEEKDTTEVESKGEEIFEGEISLVAKSQEIQSLDSIEEGINSLFLDENIGSTVKMTPSAPPVNENLVFTLYDEGEELYESPLNDFCRQNQSLSQTDESENFPLYVESENPEYVVEEFSSKVLEKEEEEVDITAETKNKTTFLDDHAKTEKMSFPVEEVTGESEIQEISIDNPVLEPVCSLLSLSHHGKQDRKTDYRASEGLEYEDLTVSLNDPVGEVIGDIENQEIGIENLILEPAYSLHLLTHQGKQENFLSVQKMSSVANLNSSSLNKADHPLQASGGLENEDQMTSLNDHGKNYVPVEYSSPFAVEYLDLSLPGDEVFWEFTDDRENQTPGPLFAATGLSRVEKLSSEVNLYSAFSSEADHPASKVFEKKEDQNVSMKYQEPKDVLVEYSAAFTTESINSPSLSSDEDLLKITYETDNQTSQSIFAATLPPHVEKSSSFVNLSSACSSEADHPAFKGLEKNGDQNVFVSSHECDDVLVEHSAPFRTASVKSSLPSEKYPLEITDDKENQTPYCHVSATNSSTISDKTSSFGSIWLRRGKPASVQIQTGQSGRKTTKDSVHAEDKRDNEVIKESISKELFSCLNEEEEEIFTPDKENFTPDTLMWKSMKKMGKLNVKEHSEPCRSFVSNTTLRTNVHPEEYLSPDKNNQSSRILRERKSVKPTSGNLVMLEQGSTVKKKGKPERVPFQSLTVNSASKTISEVLGPKMGTRSNATVNHTQSMVKKVSSPLSNNAVQDNSKRGWIMVVDTAALLDKKSRKSLELLQGLKGTRLMIPRMVLKELDCLKQRGSLFRRKTEASLVLEWIEECMVNTNWWISVQSSEEDRRLTAPTPLACPQSPFCDDIDGFTFGTRPILSVRSIMEIVSPTEEDHILDCALLCRKTKADKRLVVLSDDVTLKIKAMAEGLICEPVKEFRESLVNPFSERFLWTDSSPRGLTWSYLDDVILRENYSRYLSKKASKGDNAKGLKLILLHNSHYRQQSAKAI